MDSDTIRQKAELKHNKLQLFTNYCIYIWVHTITEMLFF